MVSLLLCILITDNLHTYKNWKPVLHSVFKDSKLRQELHEVGYTVVPFLDKDQIVSLKKLYELEHSLDMKNGGMFYSLYSKDLEYRKRIHNEIANIVSPSFERFFNDFKNLVNIFITKASGGDSEFYLHQDSTALNEFEHSALSIWIPLQDITTENGALAVIEKTHHFFSPYRGITIKPPFRNIQPVLKEYLKPIYLKAGEAILFDSRVIHNSLPNTSGKDRLVVLCGIFPKDAKYLTCYKGPDPNAKIELIQEEDSFILENKSFYYDCHSRPLTGSVLREVEDDFPLMDKDTFEELCRKNSIEKQFAINSISETVCHFEAEPRLIKKTEIVKNSNTGLLSRIKSYLSI